MNKNYWGKYFLAPAKMCLITFVIISTILNCADSAQIEDIVLEEKEFVVFEVEITNVVLPNNNSFTLLGAENTITCEADIKPDTFDSYNNSIKWEVIDNPNIAGDSGSITISETGPNISFDIIASEANDGRGYPLNFQIKAYIEIEAASHESIPSNITQDEVDQCREEYIDMYKNTIPGRNEFSNHGGSAHFSFSELNYGDYSWAIIKASLYNGLETTRTNLEHSMWITSGYRNPIHNAGLNPPGALESYHIYGRATDVAIQDFNGDGVTDYTDRLLLRDAAITTGTTELLWNDYQTHIHVAW